MIKKMVTTQPGLFFFTDKDSAFQVTKTGATVNGKELGMSEAWAWIMDAIDTKVKRVPDPDTGLVPCGCGGKAVFEGSFLDEEVPSSYRVSLSCIECGISTIAYEYEQEAMKAWNTAMGWRAEE